MRVSLQRYNDTEPVDSPFKSVETPVAKSPREATAREPPRSTEIQALDIAIEM